MSQKFKEHIITIILSSIIGLFSYFFVNRYFAEESRVNYSVDVIKLISDLKPSLSINIHEECQIDGVNNILNKAFSIKNISTFPVDVKDPELDIIIKSNGNHEGERHLSLNNDYELLNFVPIGSLTPGESKTYSLSIKFNEKTINLLKNHEEFQFKISINVSVNSTVIVSIENLMGGYINKESLESISNTDELISWVDSLDNCSRTLTYHVPIPVPLDTKR